MENELFTIQTQMVMNIQQVQINLDMIDISYWILLMNLYIDVILS